MGIDRIREENLRELIKKHGGLTSFSKVIEKSPSQISQWLNHAINQGTGKPRNISTRSCRQIEEILHLPQGWFDQSHEVSNVEPIENQNLVPLISWVQAGSWTAVYDQRIEAQEWLPCPVKYEKGIFALTVHGISMFNPTGKRSFRDGDIIYINPMMPAVNKSLVIARNIDDQDEVTFKQLIIEDKKRLLMALNPDWKPPIMPCDGFEILGVVIGKFERW